ncbi:MAG: glycine--tRNA ligase [Halobacteriaceae archaeon]
MSLDEFARRRGFFFQANESYGGVSGFYTYGPVGTALKRRIEDVWRDRFVVREDNMEIDAPTVTPAAVLRASGHVDTFDDMLVACETCGESHRADHLVEDHADVADAESLATDVIEDLIASHEIGCPDCGAPLAGQPVEPFNLMFETSIGPGGDQPAYLRPETAQGMFVEFPRLKEYARGDLPFAVAQVGAGYRNEISPRNAIIRVRELTMAELEQFFDPSGERPSLDPIADVELQLYTAEAQQAEGTSYRETTVGEAAAAGRLGDEWLAYYVGRAAAWFQRVGVDPDRLRFREHLSDELSHYAAGCWDAEAEVDGDWIELAGLASRTDYDLAAHAEHTDENYTVFKQYDEPKTVERARVDPDMSVLGPAFGSDAEAVADALAELAARDRGAFDGDTVTVTVDDEAYEVAVEDTGFRVEEETEAGRHIRPHVVEPAFGVGRVVYTVLAHNYETDEIDGEQRDVLRLPVEVAPTTVAVFPLMDRDGLADRAEAVATSLREAGLRVDYDDSGAIGRRYRRQDEVGTPFCVTVDYDTLEDETVTLRERDTTAQVRVPIGELPATVEALADGETTFEALTSASDGD